ncbi:fibrillin-1-like protein, partial [Leptotrombidium deliense]
NSSHFHSSGSNFSSSSGYNESFSYEEWNRTQTKHYGSNCSLGYTWNTSTNACEDVDECSLPEEKCAIGSKCKNTPGSFQCERHKCDLGFKLNDAGECTLSECKEGYIFSPVWNECKDINECLTDAHKCSFKCVNTLGSYNCVCKEGEKLNEDNRTCVADPCLSNPCDEFEDCINKNGTHSCESKTDAPDPVDTQPCGPGMLEDEKGNCVKGDPCKTPGICEHKCRFLGPGQHVCECPMGFDLNLTDNKSCVDIDECSKGITHCPDVCTNTIGSFKCECEEGMKPSESNANDCVDIDECEKPELNNCTARSKCMNLTPGFKCNCLPGFRRLGHDHFSQCLDINECDGDPCTGPKQLCENTPGSFKCNCESGYEMDDESNDCMDMDECTKLAERLKRPMTCHNTEGSYYLRCPHGFRPNNVTLTCDDKNECEASPCGEGSRCVNTIGSYKCECTPGFQLNIETKTCEDVNECEFSETKSLCKHGCENLVGAFRCVCPEEGYLLMPDNVTCADFNECEMGLNDCAEICVNTVGSYRCECNIGFTLLDDKMNCRDINECEDLPDSCVAPATCRNTIGSFVCSCPHGFTLNENNFTCNDVNECLLNETCSNACINTYGSHVCLCPNGYKLKADRKSCKDIDECEDESSCNKYTENCINKDGGYSCSPKCPAGYKPTNTSIECEDIDECNEGLSKCNPGDTCENLE